jgi:hypothetical protein
MWWRVLACVMAGAWLAAAGEARAGTYDVYGCRLPDGSPIAALGWTPTLFSPDGYSRRR